MTLFLEFYTFSLSSASRILQFHFTVHQDLQILPVFAFFCQVRCLPLTFRPKTKHIPAGGFFRSFYCIFQICFYDVPEKIFQFPSGISIQQGLSAAACESAGNLHIDLTGKPFGCFGKIKRNFVLADFQRQYRSIPVAFDDGAAAFPQQKQMCLFFRRRQ